MFSQASVCLSTEGGTPVPGSFLGSFGRGTPVPGSFLGLWSQVWDLVPQHWPKAVPQDRDITPPGQDRTGVPLAKTGVPTWLGLWGYLRTGVLPPGQDRTGVPPGQGRTGHPPGPGQDRGTPWSELGFLPGGDWQPSPKTEPQSAYLLCRRRYTLFTFNTLDQLNYWFPTVSNTFELL